LSVPLSVQTLLHPHSKEVFSPEFRITEMQGAIRSPQQPLNTATNGEIRGFGVDIGQYFPFS